VHDKEPNALLLLLLPLPAQQEDCNGWGQGASYRAGQEEAQCCVIHQLTAQHVCKTGNTHEYTSWKGNTRCIQPTEEMCRPSALRKIDLEGRQRTSKLMLQLQSS